MHTVTLLTAPAAPSLDPALVDSLRNAWGGGDATWLAPDECAQFAVAAVPGNRWDVWAECQKMGVDLLVAPGPARPARLLLADMDSTMIEQECIDELAEAVGVGERVREITARAMNGELDFEAALTERVGLLRGLPEARIDEVRQARITLMPGAPELVATMRARGAYTALVSGGFTAFTGPIARQLGFDEHRANRLITSDRVLTGEVARPILGREAKEAALAEIAANLGIGHGEVLAVGDGANDLGMLGRAGMGVALHAKPAVAARCDLRVNFGDLTALLYLQGIPRSDFVAA